MANSARGQPQWVRVLVGASASSPDEVKCTAGLALRDGTNVEYDYRIYKGTSGTKVQITDWRC